MKTKQYFLILASLAIAPIALGYGASPQWFARTFLGVAELDLDFAHILRAVMFLYLALGLFWLFSAFSDTHGNTAVLTIVSKYRRFDARGARVFPASSFTSSTCWSYNVDRNWKRSAEHPKEGTHYGWGGGVILSLWSDNSAR